MPRRNKAAQAEYMRAYRRKKYHENPEPVREDNRRFRLKTRFGITIGEYEEILSGQKGVCGICYKPPGKRRLAIDHNHKTGEIRGLLCYNCNRGLGWFKGGPGQLDSAAKYLRSTLWQQ